MRSYRSFRLLAALVLAPFACLYIPSLFAAAPTAITVARESTGVVLHNGEETLHLTVCSPTMIHVVAGPGNPSSASPQQPWIVNPCQPSAFEFAQDEKSATVSTSALKIVIDIATGKMTFNDAAGNQLLKERGQRQYTPQTINGEKLYRVDQRFSPEGSQGFYGFGQHQSGAFNYRDTLVTLEQVNTDVAVPLLISSNGYGLMWNTAGRSHLNNRFQDELVLTTDAADAIDYFFIDGPEIDSVIHQYREMTGRAPLFGEWAYGFVQSKDRYKSAQELLDIAGEYRAQHVPLDLIVQDWFWWTHQGDPEFSEDYLKPHPDVAGALKQLHDEHIHAMISIWPSVDEASNTFKLLKNEGLMIDGTSYYDATNPKARDEYWRLLASKVFAEGWDGFWLDATEPEVNSGDHFDGLFHHQLSIGSGARYTNVFPLLHTQGIYEHWRATTDKKRVLILARSAFLGEQRNAVVTWSGDVYGTFMNFARQIPAGLNFALSGLPYWTTDIGGYSQMRDTKDPHFQELFTRWYEFGAFCPIFRTHGHRANDTNEVFSYGDQTPTLIAYDKLRYRLLPYIYSLAWRVTSEDYTMQRPLLMDWRTDEAVRDIGDQYMFGPSFLVNPVTAEGATSRMVYLPPTAGWYDFWTGERLNGGQHIVAPAPLNRIPLYVRAGSILPMGPEIEYAGEKPDAPIELRIYRGANGSFNLYEDEGDSYAYEKGAYAITPISWEDATSTVTIGARKGSYPGMVASRSFNVTLVGASHGVGGDVTETGSNQINYDGKQVSLVVK